MSKFLKALLDSEKMLRSMYAQAVAEARGDTPAERIEDAVRRATQLVLRAGLNISYVSRLPVCEHMGLCPRCHGPLLVGVPEPSLAAPVVHVCGPCSDAELAVALRTPDELELPSGWPVTS